jgi:hypothetical protein
LRGKGERRKGETKEQSKNSSWLHQILVVGCYVISVSTREGQYLCQTAARRKC